MCYGILDNELLYDYDNSYRTFNALDVVKINQDDIIRYIKGENRLYLPTIKALLHKHTCHYTYRVNPRKDSNFGIICYKLHH